MHSEDFDSASTKEAAADWFVRRRDGLSPEAERAYQAWVGADPRHAAAMAELRATWEAVSFPARAGRGREAAGVLDRWAAARRRPYVLATAGLAVAAALAFGFLQQYARTNALRPATAVVVRPNITALPDGSTVELNRDAEFTADFTPDRRNIRLVRGEAFFSVTKDAARPFIVSAGGTEVRAVGTAFAVRSDPQGVGVLVTEGRVAVAPVSPRAPKDAGTAEPPASIHPIYLDAGRSVALTHVRFGENPPPLKPVSTSEIGAALAWRSKRVEFSRMPLSDVAALFNARNRVQLAISDRAIATIPISGIFWSDDPEGFVRLLESGLEVRAERAFDRILLRRRYSIAWPMRTASIVFRKTAEPFEDFFKSGGFTVGCVQTSSNCPPRSSLDAARFRRAMKARSPVAVRRSRRTLAPESCRCHAATSTVSASRSMAALFALGCDGHIHPISPL